jgi:hypothetical protein
MKMSDLTCFEPSLRNVPLAILVKTESSDEYFSCFICNLTLPTVYNKIVKMIGKHEIYYISSIDLVTPYDNINNDYLK